MSASPPPPTQSAKRPLEDASSPMRSGDQPDAKRLAIDKVIKNDDGSEVTKPEAVSVPASSEDKPAKEESNDKANANNGADETAWIHIRAVISSPEAATIIGKGGENVSNIRKMSGAKCTVSDYQKGAVERILTVSGVVDAVAKVCTAN